MQDVFCREVLGLPGVPDANTKVFDLSRIKDPNFDFPVTPEDGIANVSIKTIVAEVDTPKKTLTLDTNTDHLWNDARKHITGAVEGMQFSFDDAVIRKVRLRVAYEQVNYKKPKPITFSISEPSRCDLGDDPRHHALKRKLEEWGLMRKFIESKN
jgi:hypothetical protein